MTTQEQRKRVEDDFRCRNCANRFTGDLMDEDLKCPKCGEKVNKLDRLGGLLEKWYYPRRWLVAVNRPRVNYLIEQLWSSNGQGVRLYEAISPEHTNYDIFLSQITKCIARGVNEGWADIIFPDDPLAEDPIYRLEIKDSERFSTEVERLFPDVDWDGEITVDPSQFPGLSLQSEGETKAAGQPAEAAEATSEASPKNA